MMIDPKTFLDSPTPPVVLETLLRIIEDLTKRMHRQELELADLRKRMAHSNPYFSGPIAERWDASDVVWDTATAPRYIAPKTYGSNETFDVSEFYKNITSAMKASEPLDILKITDVS